MDINNLKLMQLYYYPRYDWQHLCERINNVQVTRETFSFFKNYRIFYKPKTKEKSLNFV